MNHGFSYLVSAELTDVGLLRKNNEDAVLRLADQGVFCVADGMGGAQGGEVASQATVDALRQAFTVSPDASYAVTAAAAARLVARALDQASGWIKAHADGHGLAGAGSTAVVLVFDQIDPSRAVVLHAGDSRAYRFRDDTLLRLSADHSFAAAAGLADDRALAPVFRGAITRAVGLEETVRLEETPTDVRADDLFLLCSDGLTQMVSDPRLHKLLHRHRGDAPRALAKLLVEEALKAGGEDNVSVVVVRVGRRLPPAPTRAVPPQTRALEASAGAPAQASVQTGDGSGAGRPPPGATQTFAMPPPGESGARVTALAPRQRLPGLLFVAVALLLVAVALALLVLHARVPHGHAGAGDRPAVPATAMPPMNSER